jgi:hypothetical protein
VNELYYSYLLLFSSRDAVLAEFLNGYRIILLLLMCELYISKRNQFNELRSNLVYSRGVSYGAREEVQSIKGKRCHFSPIRVIELLCVIYLSHHEFCLLSLSSLCLVII